MLEPAIRMIMVVNHILTITNTITEKQIVDLSSNFCIRGSARGQRVSSYNAFPMTARFSKGDFSATVSILCVDWGHEKYYQNVGA